MAGYIRATREPQLSALLVFPVYLAYQLGLLLTPGIRNGADAITDLLLLLGRWQPEALFGLGLASILAYGVLLYRMRKKQSFAPKLFGLLALEGALHGIVMVLLISRVMQVLPLEQTGSGNRPFHVDVIMSLGAGFHEELLFRVVLFGGLVYGARRIWRETSLTVVIAAAVISSLLFSAVHYVGPLGDPFALGSFLYRFFAGCYFAAIYRLRGFAVAVYAHAIYDIGVFALT